jgi:hypothetical protein
VTAKAPERVTLHWYGMAGVLQDSNREVDNPVDYVLASVHERVVAELEDQKKWRAMAVAERDDWHKVADARSVEINRLDAQLSAINTCVVCHCELEPSEDPPHCEDCVLTGEEVAR